MKYKLSDLAEIRIGYQARGRIEPDELGTHRLIQFKDVDDVEGLKLNDLFTITPERDVSNYLVHHGDVLFASRGSRNVACAIVEELGNAVAAGNFYILRVKSAHVLPEYLAWYINQSVAQAALKDMARGVTIQTVPKSAFETLEVVIPPLDVQRKIVRMADLVRREYVLNKELMDKRRQLAQFICLKAAKQEK